MLFPPGRRFSAHLTRTHIALAPTAQAHLLSISRGACVRPILPQHQDDHGGVHARQRGGGAQLCANCNLLANMGYRWNGQVVNNQSFALHLYQAGYTVGMYVLRSSRAACCKSVTKPGPGGKSASSCTSVALQAVAVPLLAPAPSAVGHADRRLLAAGR